MDTYKKIISTVDEHIFLFCSNIVEANPEIQLEDILKLWCEIQDKNFEETFDQYIKLANKQKKINNKIIQNTNIDEEKNTEESSESKIIIEKLDSDDTEEEFSVKTKIKIKNCKKNEKHQCSYIFQKGLKIGQKCSSNAKKDLEFCGKHSK